MVNRIFKIIIIVLLFFCLINGLHAQTFNLQSLPSNKSKFNIRFLKPYFASDFESSTMSGVYELSFNIPISTEMNLISTIPYSSYNLEANFGLWKYKFKEHGFGNIFIGAQTNPEIIDNKNSIYSFGLFLPTAEEDVGNWSAFANYYEFHQFIPNSLTLYFNYAYHNINKNGFRYGFEIGPNILIPTKDDNAETEIYAHYGISSGYQANKLLLNLELIGIAIILEDIDNFDDRFIHLLNFGAAWTENIITPKIFYKIYLKEDFNDFVDGVLGIEISISTN